MHLRILGTALTCALVTAACGGNDSSGDTGPLTPPKQQRTATLDFTDSASVYLMSVYSTPSVNEASSASDLQYDIAPGAATSGLSITRLEAQAATMEHAWQGRLAFEADRRAQIDAHVAGMLARGETFQYREALTSACACSDTQTCVAGSSDCVSSVQYSFNGGPQRTFYVVGSVTSGGVKVTLVSDNQADVATPAQLMQIATDFADAAAIDLRVVGQADHSGVLDVDGNGAITVAVTNDFGSLGSDVAGAFIFADFLDAGAAGADGNHADILWARRPNGTTYTHDFLIGTLAHEYQHLASFALRSKLGDPTQVREVLWLDEGISHVMEDLTGWGGSTVDAYAQALQNWDNAAFAGPNDSVEQRGRAYMLIRYLIDQRARGKGATDAKADSVLDAANELISPLYSQSRRGFQHQLFQDARSSGQVLDSIRAVYTSDNPEAPAADASKQYLPTANSPRANGQLIGFNPFATYKSSSGADVPLAGPTVDDSNDAGITAAISDSIPDSGAHFYLVTGGSGTINLTMTADDSADIDLDAIKVK